MFAMPPQAQRRLSNWAGNLTYSTHRVQEAASINEIRSTVRLSERLKVQGTRHCFNTIADSRHQLLSLRGMNKILSIDTKQRTAKVEPGVRYGDLALALESQGFALHNLASLPHISVVGASSTATHGSGEKLGNLSSAVSALELMTASGEVVELSRGDGETFRGAAVGLGALGVLTSITVDIEPTYSVRQYVYENLPLDQMRDHFDKIQASAYSVSLFTDWRDKRINEVWIKSRVGDAAPFPAEPEFYGGKLARRNLHPIAELSAENCTEQMGVPGPWHERLPHFRMGFTPSAGEELQAEYFVPRRNAVDAILAVERLRDRISPHLLISEIRTIAADDLWMSPCYAESCIAIHFTWKPDWPAVRRVLPLIEKELAPYKPRPHWGKLFTMAPAELRSRYERLEDFRRLAAEYDPKGKFRNEFLETMVFAR